MRAVATGPCAVARALLPYSDLSAVNLQGKNAFHLCASVGNSDMFSVLLPLMEDVDVRTRKGADVEGRKEEDDGHTALHIACSRGQHAMVAALLARGASRISRDSMGRTPTHWAASDGQLGCAILLVGWPGSPEMLPCFVDTVDAESITPLHDASMRGHTKLCGVLIGAGARLDAKASDGNTPLTFAQRLHPTKADLIALLSGNGPAGLPGTVCAACGKTATLFCPACGDEVYCGAECMELARAGHEAACKARQAELRKATTVTRVRIVS